MLNVVPDYILKGYRNTSARVVLSLHDSYAQPTVEFSISLLAKSFVRNLHRLRFSSPQSALDAPVAARDACVAGFCLVRGRILCPLAVPL